MLTATIISMITYTFRSYHFDAINECDVVLPAWCLWSSIGISVSSDKAIPQWRNTGLSVEMIFTVPVFHWFPGSNKCRLGSYFIINRFLSRETYHIWTSFLPRLKMLNWFSYPGGGVDVRNETRGSIWFGGPVLYPFLHFFYRLNAL